MEPTADGTGGDFVAHWDWAAERGLLNRNTANALKAASRAVMGVEGPDWESINVRSMNVDSLLDRFENLRKKDFTPDSLASYRSRFKRAYQLYLSFLADPRNYRPQSRDRERQPAAGVAPTRRDRTRTDGPPRAEAAVEATSAARLIKYPFPIREGVIAELFLPVDLRKEEARRLAAFLDSLSITAEEPRLLPPRSDPT